ncbi:MAG TPA: cation diffusion facilitator family transporter [Bryobacteraceae bacterium]|nr:cation diffusion facilitator family transporter [Bryobacteraceae bacterium]
MPLHAASPEANAMRVSLAAGCLMLAAKTGAYLLTGSAAIFSDAAESVVHILAVAFAAFSVWLSAKPAGRRSPYGFERVAFFSAGFEGAVIVGVAILIISQAVHKWRTGIAIGNLGAGALITIATVLVNAALGWYLIRTGRRLKSLILVADGQHVLTDSLTSLGAVAGLSLVLLTGWKPFDPLFALATALNILWTGIGLVWRAAAGLMDITDSRTEREVAQTVERLADEFGIGWHDLQFRDTGRRLLVTVHLLFAQTTALGAAHRTATEFEQRLAAALARPADVVTHLEAAEDHAQVHAARG